MHNDHLFRISLKCIIRNDAGQFLVVKEGISTRWTLPGGGMDHGESIPAAIARELKEEVDLDSPFTYDLLTISSPHLLPSRPIWQLRVLYVVVPERLEVGVGVDSSEIAFLDKEELLRELSSYDDEVITRIASL